MGDDLEHKGCHMQLDEPFPLEIVPSRVRHAMLDEFKGRRPTMREVAQIPDAYWLATPAIGRKVLQTIRAVVQAPRPQTDAAALPRLTDAELLDRLESLQRELLWMQDLARAGAPKSSRSRNRFQGRARKGSRPDDSLSLG
jgi:hypothetical protein